MNLKISIVIYSRSGNENKTERMLRYLDKAYTRVDQIILIVDKDFTVDKLIYKADNLSIISSDFISPWAKAEAALSILNQLNTIILIPDDDYFYYTEKDIENFISTNSDYACINYAMVKKNPLNFNKKPIYEIFNGWRHHIIAANITDSVIRVEDFKDQGVNTFWGMYNYEHFKNTMQFASKASKILIVDKIDLTQIIEDCINLINLNSRMFASTDSWCLRMLDRKSTTNKTYILSNKVFEILTKDFTEVKKTLIKFLSDAFGNNPNNSFEYLEKILKEHTVGYISANSRVWRDGPIVYYCPNDSKLNYTKRLMLNKSDKDEIKILVTGELNSSKDVALKYSWLNTPGFKKLYTNTGSKAIIDHNF